MPGLRDDELASLRACVDGYLPDTCTVQSTGQVFNCRLAATTAATRVPHLPYMLDMTKFVITLEDDALIKSGAVLTVTDHEDTSSMGTYVCIDDEGPERMSWAIENRIVCFLQRFPDGSLNLFTNQSVQFYKDDGTLSIPVQALVIHTSALGAEMSNFVGVTQNTWACFYDPSAVAFPLKPNYGITWLTGPLDDSGNPRSFDVSTIIPDTILGCSIALFQFPSS